MTANELASHRRTSPLCEAMCGLTLDVAGDRLVAVRGGTSDAFSRGCLNAKSCVARSPWSVITTTRC